MSRSSQQQQGPLLYAIIVGLALLLHLPLLLLVVLLMQPTDQGLPETYTIDPIQFVEEEEEEKDEVKELPVVSLDKPEVETAPPEEATALDRYNQKVEQEMVRKRDGREPGLPIKSPPQRPQPQPKNQKTTPPRADDSERVTPEVVEEPTLADEEKQEAEDEDAAKARVDDSVERPSDADPNKDAAPDAEASDNEASESGRFDPSRIMPNFENAFGKGGSGPKDYLAVPEGDKDLLNRKETRYWAFFDRLKTSVRRQWKPNSVYRAHDPRGQIYGVEDRLTIIHVTLKGDGSVHKMYVEKPSGLAFLDNEAMRAFRAAQPFPNPPEALKDESGEITFRFGFMFEINSRGGRIIRYRR